MVAAITFSPRATMAALYRAPEPDVLKPLLERARLSPESRERVMGHALGLLAYPVRRLLESGANSSFVHRLADER